MLNYQRVPHDFIVLLPCIWGLFGWSMCDTSPDTNLGWDFTINNSCGMSGKVGDAVYGNDAGDMMKHWLVGNMERFL